MFLTEKELKDKFWENYNYSGRALRYEFESPIREGNADLVTVEIFQDRVQYRKNIELSNRILKLMLLEI